MITRFEQSADRLCIDSRMRLRWGQVGIVLVIAAVLLAMAVGVTLASSWMLRAVGLASSRLDVSWIATFALVLGGASVVGLAWMLTARERLTVAHGTLEYERYRGPLRTERTEYDLLAMHGLRCDVLIATLPVREHPAPPHSCLEGEGDGADYAFGDSLAVWHRGEPFKFGHTLEPVERPVVAKALLDYDRAFRARLGLNPAQGLSDIDVWTSTRSLTLSTPVPLFGDGFLGHKSDFDK